MADLKLFNQTITSARTQDYLTNVLHEKKDVFVTNLIALVANNEMLQECEPLTIMYAALKATTLDLPLDQNLGFAYVLPYKNTKKGVMEAQFQIGYKGIVQLAARSGLLETLNVTDVREGEFKARDRRTGKTVIEWIDDDAEREKIPVVGYLGYFKLQSGYEKEIYWSIEELKQHGMHYSQTFRKGYGVWKDNFDAMARKTVLKLMLNKGDAPMSVQLAAVNKYDQSVIRVDEKNNEEVEYVDNPQDVQQAEVVETIQVDDAQAEAVADLFK